MARKIDELFFELRSRVEGLSGDLDDAERQLGKLETFIQAHPVAAAAALGAALVEIGKKAVDAAEETDASMRAIAASTGQPLENLKELGQQLDEIANKSGRATRAIEEAAVQAAQERPGTSPQDVANVVGAATLFSDATGTQLSASISLLDQVIREFHLSSSQARDALAQIDAAAKAGHVSVADLAEGFAAAAPVAAKFGLDLDTTLRAITTLTSVYGFTGQRVARELRTLDAEGIRQLANQSQLASGALEQMAKDADLVRNSAERASQTAKNELGQALRDIGTTLLPSVKTGFQDLAAIIDSLVNFRLPSDTGVGALLRTLGGVLKLIPSPITSGPFGLGQLLGNAGANVSDRPKVIGDVTFDTYAKPLPPPPLPLNAAQKKQIESDLLSLQKLVTDFGASTNTLLANASHSAVDVASNEIDQFYQKFQQTGAEIKNKLRQLEETAPNLPSSVIDQFNAQINALNTAYKTGIQSRLQNLNALAAKEADSIRASVGQALGAITGQLGTLGLDAIQQQNDKLRAQIALATGLSSAEKDRLNQEVNIAQALEAQKAKAQTVVQQIQQIIQQARTTALTDPFAASTQVANGAIKAHDALSQMIRDGQELAKQTPDYVTLANTLANLTPAELVDPKNAAMIQGIKDQMAEILRNADDTTKSGEGYRAVLAASLGITDQQAAALAKLLGIHKDVADSARRQLQSTIDTSRAIQEAVSGALQLAQAFGAVDAKGASILGNIAQVAASIPVLAKGISDLGKVDDKGNPVATLAQVVGYALPIVGGIASIVSAITAPNPQEQAHIKALSDNSAAIQKLTDRVTTLAISGTSFAAGSQLVNQVLSGQIGQIIDRDLGHGAKIDFVATTGEQFEQLQAFAKSLGLTFDGTKESLVQLQQAAKAAGVAIGQLGNDAQSTEGYFSGLATAEGLTGVDKFNVDALGPASESPLLAGTLGGFDLSTEAGREAAKKTLLGLYQRGAPNSTNPLTQDELGGLDINQFMAAILQWIQELDALPPLLNDAASATGSMTDAATAAADAMAAAAQKISDAANRIAVSDDILGTSPTDSIQEYGQAYGIDLSGFDLTTQSGRDSAIATLQKLFKSLDPAHTVGYDAFVKEIQTLIDKIRQLPPIPGGDTAGTAASAGGAAGAFSGSGASTATGTNAAAVATQSSVDRQTDFLATILQVNRDQLAAMQKLVAAFTVPIITGPLVPPALPRGFGDAGTRTTSSSQAQVVNTGPVTNMNFSLELTLPNAIITGPQDIDALAKKLLPVLQKQLADAFRKSSRYTGDTTLPVS